jgi:hypothetical protein
MTARSQAIFVLVELRSSIFAELVAEIRKPGFVPGDRPEIRSLCDGHRHLVNATHYLQKEVSA